MSNFPENTRLGKLKYLEIYGKKLNADPHEIRHLENQDGTHYQRNVTW